MVHGGVDCGTQGSWRDTQRQKKEENETEKEHWKRPYAHETTGIATQSVVTVGVILVNIRCGICCRGFVVE